MARLIPNYYKDKDGERRLSNYQIEFSDATRSPQRKRLSLGTRDQRAAEHKKLEMEREEAMGILDPWNPPAQRTTKLSDAVSRFLSRQERLGCVSQTVAFYKDVLTRLKDSLPAGFLIGDVRCTHIEAFLDSCDLNAVSTKTYVRH